MSFLTGKTCIITGGGKSVLEDGQCGSIGYGIATAYAKEGANLVLTGRNMKKLIGAKEELETKYQIKVLVVQADVNEGADNESVIASVVRQAVDAFGRIDVLINNAQASASGVPLAQHTTEQFNLAMYSGLYSTFYYMKACYPYLKETKGSVINFASGAGLFGNFGQASYAAAKEVIRGMSRVAATDRACCLRNAGGKPFIFASSANVANENQRRHIQHRLSVIYAMIQTENNRREIGNLLQTEKIHAIAWG